MPRAKRENLRGRYGLKILSYVLFHILFYYPTSIVRSFHGGSTTFFLLTVNLFNKKETEFLVVKAAVLVPLPSVPKYFTT